MVERLLNPLRPQYLTSNLLVRSLLIVGSLLILAGLSLGAGVTDWVDYPDSTTAFLDDGRVRSLVDGWGWVYGLGALLAYAVRVRLAFRNTQALRAGAWALRAGAWRIAIELAAVSILAGLTALGLSWLSVQYIPCVLEARCE